MYVCSCNVTVRFADDAVIQWLIDNGDITEEQADTYKPTREQISDYAWQLIEQDDGEYGSISIN